MAEEQDWKSLSTIDKIEHKNWNARVEGYKEALKEMNNARDSKDPIFNSYLGVVKKMVIDNNVVAQEKALEVVLYFVEEAHVAGKVAGELCPSLILKCISSTRAITKTRSIDIMKMLIEIEKHEIVIEELLKGITNKTPKVVVGCITVLKESLNEFGSKIIPIKELFKALPLLLEDRDKGVRDAGKELIIEIYRWIGKAAMTPQLNNFKPLQVTELTAEFDKLSQVKAIPTRYLRSQKPKVMPQAVVTNNGDTVDNVGAMSNVTEVAIDPFEFIDPVEVVSKIPNDFYDKIEEKKWTDRKDALEIIEKLTNHEKLVPGDFGDLLKALLKVLTKDTQILLVTLAGKILYQIAHGLRKKYSPYSVVTIQACLEKFKEKKPTVVTVLRDCIDAAFFSTNLDAISEDVVNALNHKTPTVRSETCLFLNRIFEKSTQETLPKKHLKTFIPIVVKLCQDSSPEIREASFQVLGTAMMVVTEKHIKPFIEGLESTKMAKVMECYEKAKASVSQTKAAPIVPAPVEAPKEVKPKIEKAAPPKAGPAKKNVAGGGGGQKAPKKAAVNAAEPEIPTEALLGEDDIIAKGTELFGEVFITQMGDKNFKERISATQTLQSFLKDKTASDIPSQVIVRLILLKPGLKDNNFQVLKSKLELIKEVVVNGKFTMTIADQLLVDLIEKIGDIKNSDNVKAILTEMSDKLTLQGIATHVMKLTADSVNIKNFTEAIVWINDSIKDFGFKIDMKELLVFLKKGLQHSNPNIRQGSVKLVGTISLYVRDTIGTLLKEEKSTLKQLIDQEIEAMKSTEPPVPTRGLRNAKKPTASGDDVTDAGSISVPVEIDTDDFIQRENIGGKITDEILQQLADKSSKIKKEGFEEISKITDKCTGITGEGLQPLFAAVAKTTTDSSKIISKAALTMLDSLCKLMTKKDAEKFVKVVVPSIFSACSDSKPKSREDAISTLNTWVDKVGFPAIADGGMITDALKVESPFEKAEILSWLSPHLTALSSNKVLKKALPSDFSSEILPLLYVNLEERNPDVRKKAQEAVLPFMLVFGYEEMSKANNKHSKPASKDNIKSYLDKAKEQLPAPEPSAQKQAVKGAVVTKPGQAKEAAPKKSDEGVAVTKPKKEDTSKMTKGKVTAKEPEGATKPEEVIMLLQKTSNKRQRLIEDSKKKNLTKPEIAQLINTQFSNNCSAELMANLFSTDFKKHIVAIDMLSKYIADEDQNAIESTKQNLDLILKWFVIRFDETNTSVVNKGLDYLFLLFTILTKSENFSLHTQEANNFIPEFILKLGDKNVNTRTNVMKVLRLLINCYQPKNIVPYIERVIFETKAAKVKEGCSELSQILIDEGRIKVEEHQSLLIALGNMISERDNAIRTAALNCLVSAHNYIGDKLLKILKDLSEKDSSMLLERIKRIGKPVTADSVPVVSVTSRSQIREQTPVRDSQSVKASAAPTQAQAPTPNRRHENDMNPILSVELKLIDVEEDIKELLQPLEKITLRSSGRMPQSVNSNDAITAVIHSINSNDVKTSIQAMAQIDEVIKNQDVRPQLLTYMDNLVMSITMQLKANLGKLSEEHFIETEITDMFKGMLASLMSIFSHSDLATELNRDRLTNLLQVILRLVINDQLVTLAEGCTIIRGINILSVRILESSNQTRMLSSLLRMMMDCLRNNDTTSKYLQLIFKCIWSMTKNLSNTVNTIDLVIVLKDIHIFYNDFPPNVWEASHQDVPLRTVKTVVYSIINHRRTGVLEALYQIPNAPGKDLDQYIRKSYTKLNIPIPAVLPTPETVKESNTAPPPRITDASKPPIQSSNRTCLDDLKEIFQKIGNRHENKEGLNDLFDFKIKYPHVDLSRYLNNTTASFQRMIENGLRAISEERGQPMLSLAASTNALNHSGAGIEQCDMDPESLMRRLKSMRIKAGLDKAPSLSSETDAGPNSPLSKLDDMEVSVIGALHGAGDGPQPVKTLAASQNRRMSATDLNAFRQRINFYKNPRN